MGPLRVLSRPVAVHTGERSCGAAGYASFLFLQSQIWWSKTQICHLPVLGVKSPPSVSLGCNQGADLASPMTQCRTLPAGFAPPWSLPTRPGL